MCKYFINICSFFLFMRVHCLFNIVWAFLALKSLYYVNNSTDNKKKENVSSMFNLYI